MAGHMRMVLCIWYTAGSSRRQLAQRERLCSCCTGADGLSGPREGDLAVEGHGG